MTTRLITSRNRLLTSGTHDRAGLVRDLGHTPLGVDLSAAMLRYARDRLLASHLGLPIVSRDAITETLADTLGVPSRDLVGPSFAVFWRILSEQVGASLGAVGETNLHRGVSEPAVPLGRACGPETRVLQDQSRGQHSSIHRAFERGERHWCFDDVQRVVHLRAGKSHPAWERAKPLGLNLPSLIVDTSDGYTPEIDAIVAHLRAPVSAPK
jgi:hypothetical protein